MFLRRLGSDARSLCQSTSGCPDIWEMADGNFAVIGEDITRLAIELPAPAGCAANECMVRIPRDLLVRAKSDIPNQA